MKVTDAAPARAGHEFVFTRELARYVHWLLTTDWVDGDWLDEDDTAKGIVRTLYKPASDSLVAADAQEFADGHWRTALVIGDDRGVDSPDLASLEEVNAWLAERWEHATKLGLAEMLDPDNSRLIHLARASTSPHDIAALLNRAIAVLDDPLFIAAGSNRLTEADVVGLVEDLRSMSDYLNPDQES